MYSFDNKVVWITGSSTGIGRAAAIAFADHGADVVIHRHSNLESEIIAKDRKCLLV